MRIALFALAATLTAGAQDTTKLNLMPWPSKIEMGQGSLAIDGSFSAAVTGVREPRLDAAAQRLLLRLAKQTGIAIPYRYGIAPANPPTLLLNAKGAGEAVQTPQEDESYTLEVTPKQARINANTSVGVLRGIETFLQLVAPAAEGFAVPALRIEDTPRFAWRGLHVDVARRFLPMENMKRTLDAMAGVKLNVLHWHITDDQGFRIESKRFPKLHEMGSDGLWFTQDQVRELIAYARERGIRVMPEFDMPGHTTAWFVGMPELASAPGPYKIEREWGIFDPAMDPTREETYKFLEAFIAEMAALFPDPYFHIGGDEVNGKQWKASERIQQFMREHNFKSTHELQGYFENRLLPIVQKTGKRMVGWDEIFQPGLPKDAIIHSWRGPKSLAQAAQQGYQSILSAGYYLDLMFPASYHYMNDPLGGAAASLTPEQKKLILGGEACMWSEFVSPEVLDGRVWPRMAAIAERFWSPAEMKNVDSMYRRLEPVSRFLEESLGLTHRSYRPLMLDRLAGGGPTDHLRILDDVLVQVEEYQRPNARKHYQYTPLNRLVDATRPESDTAREFAKLVDAWLAGDKSRLDTIRLQLVVWRANHAALRPQLTGMLAENGPLSEDLAAIAAGALEALDGKGAGNAKTAIARTKRRKMEMYIAVVPAIEKLLGGAAR